MDNVTQYCLKLVIIELQLLYSYMKKFNESQILLTREKISQDYEL